MNEFKKAMREFGFRSGTVVTISEVRFSRALVCVNGDTFGIWDFDKKTFVD